MLHLEGITSQSEPFEYFPCNWPIWNDSRCRIIARFDRNEKGLLSALLYFCTPSWSLITELFNRDISPGLYLYPATASSRPFVVVFIRFSCPFLATCNFPHSRHEHYDLEKNFTRHVARLRRCTTHRLRKSSVGHTFPLHEKVHSVVGH